MSTSDTLKRLIKKQSDVTKLEQLRDSGLALMVADVRLDDFVQSDADYLVGIINDRISELQAA